MTAERRGNFLRNSDGEIDALHPGAYEFNTNDVIEASRVIITIEDERLRFDGYGRLPELENGIEFYLETGGQKESFLDYNPEDNDLPFRIKRTHDWAEHCYDFQVFKGTGGEKGVARFSLFKAGAPSLMIPGDRIVIEFPDNLYLDGRGLIRHRFKLDYEVIRKGV